MKIGEVLEMTKEKRISEIAKLYLNIGEKPAREALKKAGCYTLPGKKGWFFDGNKETLEKSIYDFHKNNQPTNETKKVPPIVRKRFSVDLDTELIKQLKLKSVFEDRKIYELVERALKNFLHD